MTDRTDALIACTLEAGDLKERLECIGDLNARSLLGSRRKDLSLILDYALDAVGDVQQMVAGEQACCAFLAFAIEERTDMLRVTITAPEGAREVADDMFEKFAALASGSVAAAKSCGCTNACGA